MSHKRASARVVALAITTTLAASHASALTFASFGVTGGTRFSLSGNTFTAGETGSFSVASAVPLPAALGAGPFSATLTLTGTLALGTGSELTMTGSSNSIISQNLSSLSFTIVGASGAAAGKNLLSGNLITPAGNSLQGNVNNTTQSSTASIGASGTEANIGFTSDLFAFLPGTRDMTFTLNNISPSVLSVAGTTTTYPFGVYTIGDIQNFLADASANFSANPAPNGIGAAPEPGVFAMLFSMGVSGVAFGLRSRRRR